MLLSEHRRTTTSLSQTDCPQKMTESILVPVRLAFFAFLNGLATVIAKIIAHETYEYSILDWFAFTKAGRRYGAIPRLSVYDANTLSRRTFTGNHYCTLDGQKPRRSSGEAQKSSWHRNSRKAPLRLLLFTLPILSCYGCLDCERWEITTVSRRG